MKLELFNDRLNSVWKKAASASSSEQLQIELELYKRLLNIFQVGDYYYIIFNISKLEFEYISKDIEKVTSYVPSEFSINKLLEICHPDDRPYFLSFEKKAAEFLAALPVEKLMRFKVRYDYRIKRKDGRWMRILHQSTTVEHDDQGGLIRTLGVHTDISHLKMEGKPVFSIIGLDGEPSYVDIDVQQTLEISEEKFTSREKEILSLLIEGRLSKEIADILFISKGTVDKHRKNMLSKYGFRNTTELASFAVRNGLV